MDDRQDFAQDKGIELGIGCDAEQKTSGEGASAATRRRPMRKHRTESWRHFRPTAYGIAKDRGEHKRWQGSIESKSVPISTPTTDIAEGSRANIAADQTGIEQNRADIRRAIARILRRDQADMRTCRLEARFAAYGFCFEHDPVWIGKRNICSESVLTSMRTNLENIDRDRACDH